MRGIRGALLAIAVATVATGVGVTSARAAVGDDLRDGDRLFEKGDWQKAASAFDRAIAKAPGQVSAGAYGKRAAIYIILKDYQGGLAFVTKAKLRHPGAPEILEQEALMLWETARRDDAIATAEKVVAVRPQAFTNQKLIGEYYATRDPAKTITAYEAYVAARPSDLEPGDVFPRLHLGFAYLTSAREAIARGDHQAAQQLYAKAATQFETVQRRLGKRPHAQVNADNGLCAAYTGLNRFDQAVTICERVVAQPRRIDAGGSAWFNLGTAYLARKQTKKARGAATEFTRIRKTEARGYLLLGETYFAERDWTNALDSFLDAEKLIRPNQPQDQLQLSIQLGKTYRRLPAPVGGANPNLAIAVDKLSAALVANPGSTELVLELGGAYLEARQDAKAIALTERMLASAEMAKAPPDVRANMLVIAGKAHFNQHKLREARQRFEAAQQVRTGDVSIQRALVLTINEQAYAAGVDGKLAQTLLEQALQIDPASPVTITNLAVLAIERGDCDVARQHLVKLAGLRGHDVVVRTRLLARTYQCGKPAPKQAAEAYAVAEQKARKANASVALAEIYTEWAPLLWDSDLAGAIEKLEIAVQTGGQDPAIGPAAKRNLALALFRRGWNLMREGKPAEAAGDFDRAARDPSVLKGTEALALEFSSAMALLDAGKTTEAARQFKALGAKGNQAAYLRPPFGKIGTQFFGAYAGYRNGTLAARQQAAAELARLESDAGPFASKLQGVLGATWEAIAYEQWRAGQPAAAARSLDTADRFATPEARRRIALDRLVLTLDKRDLAALEAMAGAPPEALVNLGILYDQLGRPKDAYDAWQRARARGVQSRDLQKWIDAKKRIYGF
ncbi:MAG: tetratricopeptide repeat protein [Deltaproteobacteria bacterium]|nr:tetratricopeptide repeat protein [Deltaproteobacteria bacterium]MDQ3298117.1 tetratricopeptide repeat protein [Myxococcota bacterium]